MRAKQRRVIGIAFLIYLPSLILFFTAYTLVLSGEFFFGFNIFTVRMIAFSGLLIGWIGTFIQEQAIAKNIMGEQWRLLTAIPFYTSMLTLSFVILRAIW